MVILSIGSARAQTVSRSFNLQQFQPSPGAQDVLTVESPGVQPSFWYQTALLGNYADRPLELVNATTGQPVSAVVQNQSAFDLLGAVGLFDRFEVGVDLPLVFQSSGLSGNMATRLGGDPSGGGLGDLRLIGKALVWEQDRMRVGATAGVTFPTGGAAPFRSQVGIGFHPRAVADYQVGGARLLVNLGLDLQQQVQFLQLVAGNAFDYRFGAEVPFQAFNYSLAGMATLGGQIGFGSGGFAAESPLELLAGLRGQITHELSGMVAFGPGLTRGYGTPDFRVVAGIGWTPAPGRFGQPRIREVSDTSAEKVSKPEPVAVHREVPPTVKPETPVARVVPPPPPKAPVKAVLRQNKIVLLEKIYFDSNTVLPKSYDLLNQVAGLIKAHPDLLLIRVEGHTDNVGPSEVNMVFSERRANNVLKLLVEDGVAADRLEAQGYGDTRPVASNDTPEGREKNRRVEFTIVKTAEPTSDAQE